MSDHLQFTREVRAKYPEIRDVTSGPILVMSKHLQERAWRERDTRIARTETQAALLGVRSKSEVYSMAWDDAVAFLQGVAERER